MTKINQPYAYHGPLLNVGKRFLLFCVCLHIQADSKFRRISMQRKQRRRPIDVFAVDCYGWMEMGREVLLAVIS